MSPRRPRQIKALPEVALRSPVVREEELPALVVYYPNHYGTFFAFAGTPEEPPVLCACAEPAVRNLLRLEAGGERGINSNPLRMAPLDSYYFPDAISAISMKHQTDPLAALQFRPGLCHRCNLKTPTLRYCHEMYGQLFVQCYGWYIKQTYLRLGIMPMSYDYLPDVCPPEFQKRIDDYVEAQAAFKQEELRLMEIAAGPLRPDIAPDEVTYWRNVRESEAETMIQLRRRANQLRKELNSIENVTRAEFGFRGVGEGWVSETQLYQIICRLFPGEQVLRHYRPEWMDGLELDVYVPGRKLAFEYQGQQHFHPIKAWGGEKALLQVQARDARKVQICRQFGVHLVTVEYTEPLTDDHIRCRVSEVPPGS